MEEVKKILKNAIFKLFDLRIEPEVTPGREMPDGKIVDYASNVAMKISRNVTKKPVEVAEVIRDFLINEKNLTVEVAGSGFLNFTLSDEYFKTKIADFAGNFEKNISQDEYLEKKVICEFSDPNPFKVLHVGHLYTSIVGDSISRLVEFAGGEVIRANFGGDVGLHVAKTIWAVMQSFEKGEIKNLDEMTIEKIAKCYVEGSREYEDDEKVRQEIVDLNKQIFEISTNDLHDSRVAEIYWKGRELSYQYFENFYESIGVKFDKYYPESTVAKKGLQTVQEQFEKGVYEESDKAVVFKGEKYGLHTRVFINKNGLPTYEAKDVGLIFTKWDDYKFDKSIIITANDIIEYMKVVLKSIEQYAPELSNRTLHLTHGNVKLPGNEKMSSRKGNFLKAVDVIEMVSEALRKGYGSTDQDVIMGALKYAFLKYKMGGNIIFDVNESVSMTGNAGPYLQYAVVRGEKVMENVAKRDGHEWREDESIKTWQLNENEKNLIKKVIQYDQVLREAVHELVPHKICEYVFELAQEFSRFYEKVKVAGSEYEAERGEIVLAYLKVMKHGLALLGIKAPEKM